MPTPYLQGMHCYCARPGPFNREEPNFLNKIDPNFDCYCARPGPFNREEPNFLNKIDPNVAKFSGQD